MDPLTTPTPRTVRMRMGFYVVAVAVVMFGISAAASADPAIDFSTLPVKGMVTMIDLGAKKCIPCKMMVPIMEKMEKKYEGKAAIVFIDVWEHREQAQRFGIRGIPTQIFFDADGKEISRHVGFMSEADIVKTLGRLGVKP
jgi:thioredoxin 1